MLGLHLLGLPVEIFKLHTLKPVADGAARLGKFKAYFYALSTPSDLKKAVLFAAHNVRYESYR